MTNLDTQSQKKKYIFMPCHVHATKKKIRIPMRSWILDLQPIPASTKPVPATIDLWWARPLITRFISSTPTTNCWQVVNHWHLLFCQPFPYSWVREENSDWISKFSHQQPSVVNYLPNRLIRHEWHLFLHLQLVFQCINPYTNKALDIKINCSLGIHHHFQTITKSNSKKKLWPLL